MLKLLLILDAKENVSLVALICKLDILDLAVAEMNKIWAGCSASQLFSRVVSFQKKI